MSSGRGSRGGYKVLCVSCLHPKASDDVIRESLYREYNKKYGDVSVRVMHEPDERVAYVYFRNFDDARDAKHAKSRIILFDKAAVVEPVYENRRRSPSPPPPPPPPLSHPAAASSSSSSNFYHHNHHAPRYSRSRSPSDTLTTLPLEEVEEETTIIIIEMETPMHPTIAPHITTTTNSSNNMSHGDIPTLKHIIDATPRTIEPLVLLLLTTTIIIPTTPHIITEEEEAEDPITTTHSNRATITTIITTIFHPAIPSIQQKGQIPQLPQPHPTRGRPPGHTDALHGKPGAQHHGGRNAKDLWALWEARNAYAFIRYENLDQAHRAKLELSGQYIGKFQCKIGYGKVNPTPKVWVGGLGSWASGGLLESEFDRFGAIQKVDYRKGDPHAYIYFESIEAAQAAVQEMRGYPLGGQERRLRMDFADMEDSAAPPAVAGGDRYRGESSSSSSYHANYAAGSNNSGARGGGAGGGNSYPPRRPYDIEEPGRASRVRRRSEEDLRRRYEGPEEEDEGEDDEEPEEGGLEPSGGGTSGIRSLSEITKKTPNVWDGGLILKNSLFPTKLHLIEGSEEVVDSLKDETDKPHLKITQRLRLDQGKLDDVSKRMKTSGAHAIFLGVSDSNELTHENPDIQSRPLRNLVTYLKQKEAAGVISLNHGGGSSAGNNSSSSGSGNKEENGAGGGVLYCFPPVPSPWIYYET
ncbi:Putative RNAbinding protein 15like, partial [Caligus rogercresseyi]